MADNTTVLLAAAAATIIIKRRRRRREALKDRIWTRDWLLMRSSDRGIQSFVINELMGQDAGGFHSFLRMTPDQFMELLRCVEPLVQRANTVMRVSITAHEMVVLTQQIMAFESFN